MSSDLERRLDRVEEGLCPMDESALAPHYATAARVLQMPGAMAPTKAWSDWLAEKCAGRTFTAAQMGAHLGCWLNEDPRGYELMIALGPFFDEAERAQ